MERKVYDQMAKLDSCHWWFTARHRILDGVIERIVKPPKGARILELGAGTGHNLEMLSRFGEVEATDPGRFAALDRAARDLTQQLAVVRLGDRERGLAPEGAETGVVQDAHHFVVPALDTDDPERRSCDLNHTFDDGLHLNFLVAPHRWINK